MRRGYAFYHFAAFVARNLFRLVGRLEVNGLDNIPQTGPFLLFANHESILDPILIQAVCPRPVHTMAKSTQFASPLMRWVMVSVKSFPVRRYEIDPQSVRMVLRRLEQGEPVGIYPEGERSWDGRLQEPRRGTVRLALRAGVPIVPCTIAGSYDVWPRWGRSVRPGNVRIDFGEPFRLPRIADRAGREAALPAAAERIMGTLRDQLHAAGGGVPAPNETAVSTARSTFESTSGRAT